MYLAAPVFRLINQYTYLSKPHFDLLISSVKRFVTEAKKKKSNGQGHTKENQIKKNIIQYTYTNNTMGKKRNE